MPNFRPSHGRLQAIAVIVHLALLLPVADAQQPAPIRHEPLPAARHAGPRSDRVVADTAGQIAAIQTSVGTIGQPAPGKPGDDTPLYKPEAPPRVGMDRRTGADGQLHYKVVFDPSIAPFKREFAFDTVRPDVTLTASGRGLRRLPGTPQPARGGHELFWGHLRLRLQPGERVLLPSVAPTSAILQWQSIPAVALQFWRDDAGNYSVGVEGPIPADAAGEPSVDLRFLMDAPSEYFAAPLGVQKRKDDPPIVPLPAELQQRAQVLWPPLGVGRHMERGAVLARLVDWFRGFVPGVPPEKGSDPLADLVLGRKGVCRHRALGFMVIATSLGVPCRYVMNDAHAFIEVWAPLPDGRGTWQRVDLGGGSESLELQAAKNKRMHQPLWRDPFPRPPAYTSDVDDMQVSGQGAGQTWGGAKQLKGADFATGTGDHPGALPGQDAGQGAQSIQANATGDAAQPPANAAEAQRQWLRERAERLAAPVQMPALGAAARGPEDTRKISSITLQIASAMAWIGEPLPVSGALQAAGGRVSRQPIELWLIDPQKPLSGRLLGMAVTDARGRYALQLAMPADADLQVYDLVARFPGDGQLQASDSSQ